MRPPPTPLRPELIRIPTGRFGWLEDRLLHERWLAEIGPDATAVLVLFALAADRRGASFFSRERMAGALGMDVTRIDRALDRLRSLALVALRPWRPKDPDGVWQLLPLPEPNQPTKRNQATDEPTAIGAILESLGLSP